MSFIRVKEIGKKYRYAYLVENKWRKRLKEGKKGSRQKVSKYLGKVLKLEVVENKEFIPGKYKTKSEIIEDLSKYELMIRGFSEKNGIMEKDDLRYDLKLRKFVDSKGEDVKVVIEMNEGFFCKNTIRKLLNFKAKGDDEREVGINVAKAFLETGLKVPNEIFVEFFELI